MSRYFSRLSGLIFCTLLTCHGQAADDLQDSAGKLIAQPEAYETLVNPECSHCVDESKRRAGELRDDDPVLAWIRGKYEGGSVPYRFFLVPYRVISDTYGVFVFDPDAGFARGFAPSLDFSFYGWRNGVMVMRHKDGTLYSTLSGRAFAGPREGDELEPVPTMTSNWGYWSRAYPGSVVYRMYDKYQPKQLPTGPAEGSEASRGRADGRLPEYSEVLGVSVGEHQKAYPVTGFGKTSEIVSDSIAGQKLVVLWHAPTRTAVAFASELEGAQSSPVSLHVDNAQADAPFVDRNTGSRFSIEGRCVSGPLEGQTLRWLDSVTCRWFAWAAEYPETAIHSAAQPRQDAKARDDGRQALHAVLVEPTQITVEQAAGWRADGYGAVALVLDERHSQEAYAAAAGIVGKASLDLYYWIEVGRNPAMAEKHPDWMASLGMHDDWLKRFPDTPRPNSGQVAKAFPWVPIGYRKAFEAHLDRVRALGERVEPGFQGVLLNDLQGGPASCGCGNLQCRWALDYHVPATAERIPGDAAAAQFVSAVAEVFPEQQVIPIWTTECEEIDLSAKHRSGQVGTGLCESVPCAHGTCPVAFARQWSALQDGHDGPVGILALHQEFGRSGEPYRSAVDWVGQSVSYLDEIHEKHSTAEMPREKLWLVVQGYSVSGAESERARQVAHETGAGAVVVALARIDQSYEPRLVAADR